MTAILNARARARLEIVEEHVSRENAHDLPGNDDEGRLAGERIYYDRGSVLRQVGLFRDPQSFAGRLEVLLAHPLTVARAYARKLSKLSAR